MFGLAFSFRAWGFGSAAMVVTAAGVNLLPILCALYILNAIRYSRSHGRRMAPSNQAIVLSGREYFYPAALVAPSEKPVGRIRRPLGDYLTTILALSVQTIRAAFAGNGCQPE